MTARITYLTQIANYLKVQPGKITEDSYLIPTRIFNNTSTRGFLNIINALTTESNSNLIPKSPEYKAEVCQWIVYALVYGQSSNQQEKIDLLNSLDGVLLTRTYLVSNALTMADIVLYYTLQNVMESIGYLEKEKYMSVCRWFDNLQQNKWLRQDNKVIDFNTSFLSILAPAKQ